MNRIRIEQKQELYGLTFMYMHHGLEAYYIPYPMLEINIDMTLKVGEYYKYNGYEFKVTKEIKDIENDIFIYETNAVNIIRDEETEKTKKDSEQKLKEFNESNSFKEITEIKHIPWYKKIFN